jgi:hypothetical protein
MLVRKVQMAAAGKCLIYVLICGTGALMEGPNDAKRTHVRSSTLGAYCLMQLLTLAASSGGGRWSLVSLTDVSSWSSCLGQKNHLGLNARNKSIDETLLARHLAA